MLKSIARFNGGLFQGAKALDLTSDEIRGVVAASKRDWAAIDPSIFGTLFERGHDPAKRSQLGAHYTSRDDIVAQLNLRAWRLKTAATPEKPAFPIAFWHLELPFSHEHYH
jgi:hypothetical protein